MACDFFKVGQCDICGREKFKFFLDRFEFVTAAGETLTGVYCWRCAFRYDRYNRLLRKHALVLGGGDAPKGAKDEK